ncbi:MAG: prolipoprotein diacylglyceryl transferase [Anaerolineae bacterium]|nr:prolipoprotein diacylglyceryl transferase [Anaerolineae bacterium]
MSTVIDLGIGSMHLYTLAFALAILTGGLLFVRRLERRRLASAVDVLLLAFAGGLALARAEHVLLNWAYFADNTGEVLRLELGGLGWHGAALGALIALWIDWRFRLRDESRIGFTDVLDRLAPALPLLLIAAWVSCSSAGCGYGYEVSTLANYPALIAAELPDIYGVSAPRLNTPLFGLAWAVIILSVLWGTRRTTGRFWLALSLAGLGMFAIGFARADSVPSAFGLRVDQTLDLIVFGFGLACLIRAQRHVTSVQPGTVMSH